MPKTFAIVPAAGRGLRMGRDRPKQFLELAGEPILCRTLRALSASGFISGVYLVVPADFKEEASRLVEAFNPSTAPFPIWLVPGGAERQESVYNALKALPRECEWVVIHDGVRPFVSKRLLEETWSEALMSGGAIAALPATDTIKRVLGGKVVETLRRDEIWLVQTPQVFRKDLLLDAYGEAHKKGWAVTDDASLVERLGFAVTVVRGERTNVKVTMPEDLEWAEWFVSRQ